MPAKNTKGDATSPGTPPGSSASPTENAPSNSSSSESTQTSEPTTGAPSSEDAAAAAAAAAAEQEAAAAAARETELRAAEEAAKPATVEIRTPLGSGITAVSYGGAQYEVDERGVLEVAPEHVDGIRAHLAMHWPEAEDDE